MLEYFLYGNLKFNVTLGYQLAQVRGAIPSLLDHKYLEYVYDQYKNVIKVHSKWVNVDETKPVLFAVNPNTGRYMLIDGHHRVRKFMFFLKNGTPINLYGHFLTEEESKQILMPKQVTQTVQPITQILPTVTRFLPTITTTLPPVYYVM